MVLNPKTPLGVGLLSLLAGFITELLMLPLK